jgi:hypothetical protein
VADAPRLFHPIDGGFRVAALVAADQRQPRREPARVLPTERSASLLDEYGRDAGNDEACNRAWFRGAGHMLQLSGSSDGILHSPIGAHDFRSNRFVS